MLFRSSSIINVLKGSKAARTSAESGYTKGKQFVMAKNIKLIDSPGVLPYKEQNDVFHTLIGIKTKTKDKDLVIMQIMEEYPGVVEEHYDVDVNDDKEATLEIIAVKMNFLKKGGIGDIDRTADFIIKDLQRGKIKIK